jgi:hypothetical protein
VRGSTGDVGRLVVEGGGACSGSGEGGGMVGTGADAGEVGAEADVGDDGRKPRRSRRPAYALRTRSREASPAVGVGLNGRLWLCPELWLRPWLWSCPCA